MFPSRLQNWHSWLWLAALIAVFGSYGIANAPTATSSNSLILKVKPLRAPDGSVGVIEVSETLNAGTAGGAPLSFKAAISAIGVKHIADSIQNLVVTDSQGIISLDTSDDPPVSDDHYAYRHWKATRAAVLPVSIHYRIPTESSGERGPPLGMQAAGLGVAGNGVGFLLLPENTQSESTRVAWDLSDLSPGSVGVVTAGEGEVVVPGPPEKMVDQWVLAGPAVRAGAPEGTGFQGYLVGAPPFDGKAFLEWARRSYGALGAWFKYLGLPNYNLLVRAVSGPSFGTGTAGEGRGGSLVHIGSVYWPRQDLSVIQSIAFHEMTHQWVGVIYGRGSWFEEGLTVYLTMMLTCHEHLLSSTDCIRQFNAALANYYMSPGRRWSQHKIDDTPFSEETVREVPYGRGAMYFANLNVQLLIRSKGRKGLKEALYPLLERRRNSDGLSQADWEKMLNRELGPGAVKQFRRSMLDGIEEIIPPRSALGPCFTLQKVPLEGTNRPPIMGYQWEPVASFNSASCDRSSP
jgi:predicted metalloprotease with PDZ domain